MIERSDVELALLIAGALAVIGVLIVWSFYSVPNGDQCDPNSAEAARIADWVGTMQLVLVVAGVLAYAAVAGAIMFARDEFVGVIKFMLGLGILCSVVVATGFLTDVGVAGFGALPPAIALSPVIGLVVLIGSNSASATLAATAFAFSLISILSRLAGWLRVVLAAWVVAAIPLLTFGVLLVQDPLCWN